MNIRDIDSDQFFKLENPKDQIKFLLNYAVLAPSTHNTQPWLFEVDNNSCKIFVDKSLYLKQADRKGRYIFIGLGCMIENLIIAANNFNVFKEVVYSESLKTMTNLVVEKENVLVAEVFFDFSRKCKKNSSRSELFEAITKRFNARGPFSDMDLPENLLKNLENAADDCPDIENKIIKTKEKINEIAKLTAQGMIVAHNNKNFRRELSSWVRNLFSLKKDGMSWKSMRVPLPFSGVISYLIRFFNLGPIMSKLNYKSVSSAKIVYVLSSEDNPRQWLQVGRVAERAMLSAYANDFNTSIYVAAIDVDKLRNELQKVVGSKLQPQFLLCIGHMNLQNPRTARFSANLKMVPNE